MHYQKYSTEYYKLEYRTQKAGQEALLLSYQFTNPVTFRNTHNYRGITLKVAVWETCPKDS